MDTIIIITRHQRKEPVFVKLVSKKQSFPLVLFGDISECYAEFMTMSDERTGYKEYIVEPNGHIVIRDFTTFK